MPVLQSSSGKKGNLRFLSGYSDDARVADSNTLCPPSINVDITKTGEAMYRKGLLDSEVSLGEAAKPAMPFHVPQYNVTFFALNGKVKFVNHNNSDAVVDTGLSLTETDGRKVSFGEYAGDIYLINQKDGLRQIHMGRVNQTNATAGDATITVDQNLAGRLLAFGDGSGSLRIANTTPIAESYASVAATGVVTLSNTLDANVADDTIVYTVEDVSSGRPFGSGLTFWKERMIVWGVIYDAALDSSTNVIYLSSFASVTALENVLDFNVANTAAIEQVGKGGVVTNVIATRDYLYVFTQNETYFAGVADVNATTGGTPPQLLSTEYGCVNGRCSANLGNGLVAFMTNNKRIIAIRIATDTGAAVVYPDTSFDTPLRNTLALLDSDQSNSFFFYAGNENRLYMHCDVDSTRIVLKWNNEIQAMEPPNTGWSMGGMFVRDGVLYATDFTDDTIYQCGEGFQDGAGIDYEVVIAGSLLEGDDGRSTMALESLGISGRIGILTTITVESVVGGGTPQQKSFTAAGSVSGSTLGSVAIGSSTLGSGVGEEMEEYDRLFAISPTYGPSYQWRVRSVPATSGGALSVTSYTVRGRVLSSPLATLQ